MIDVHTLLHGVARHVPGTTTTPGFLNTNLPAEWLLAALDELDYGLIVLDADARVRHLNHAARTILAQGQHPLLLAGDRLRLRAPAESGALQDALLAARRGLRRLVMLGRGAAAAHVVVEPIGAADGLPDATLVILGRQQVCENLSVQCFAQLHHLTPAEADVLRALCEGREPTAIARERGVGLATVRTQIGNLRSKTGVSSIRELVLQVSSLPPMRSSLRHATTAPQPSEAPVEHGFPAWNVAPASGGDRDRLADEPRMRRAVESQRLMAA